MPIEEINQKAMILNSFETVQKIADHYNVNEDLFGQAFFKPAFDLKVEFKTETTRKPVYYGNRIEAKHVIKMIF